MDPESHLSQSAFTLVELMIVVAIIGILASVAVPNFKKYQAQAITVEAKSALSSAYTSEQTFSAEYGSFTACLNKIGYNPGTSSNRYYAVGFYAVGTCGSLACNSDLGAGAPSCADVDGETFFVSKVGSTDVTLKHTGSVAVTRSILFFPSIGSDGATSAQPSTGSFTISAGGAIGGTSVPAVYMKGLDLWFIDEKKTLDHKITGY